MPAPIAYNTLEETYLLGLRAELFSVRPRAIEAVDPATGVFTLRNHGLFDGYALTLLVEGSAVPGVAGARLPVGASAAVGYQASPFMGSSDLFQLRPTGGALISSFGDAGAGVFSIVVDLANTIRRIAVNESANINETATAHNPPFERDIVTGLYPEILVGVAARRTAIRAGLIVGLANPNDHDSLDKLIAGQADDDRRLETWLAGRPIHARPTDQTPAVLENAARAGYDASSAGWYTGTL